MWSSLMCCFLVVEGVHGGVVWSGCVCFLFFVRCSCPRYLVCDVSAVVIMCAAPVSWILFLFCLTDNLLFLFGVAPWTCRTAGAWCVIVPDVSVLMHCHVPSWDSSHAPYSCFLDYCICMPSRATFPLHCRSTWITQSLCWYASPSFLILFYCFCPSLSRVLMSAAVSQDWLMWLHFLLFLLVCPSRLHCI